MRRDVRRLLGHGVHRQVEGELAEAGLGVGGECRIAELPGAGHGFDHDRELVRFEGEAAEGAVAVAVDDAWPARSAAAGWSDDVQVGQVEVTGTQQV